MIKIKNSENFDLASKLDYHRKKEILMSTGINEYGVKPDYEEIRHLWSAVGRNRNGSINILECADMKDCMLSYARNVQFISILWLYIPQNCRRQGIGTAFVNHVIDAARDGSDIDWIQFRFPAQLTILEKFLVKNKFRNRLSKLNTDFGYVESSLIYLLR